MDNHCMIFGDDIELTDNHKEQVRKLIDNYIKNKQIVLFFFCDFKPFSFYCYNYVTELKKSNSAIKRCLFYLDNEIIPPESGVKLESTDFEFLFHSRITLEEVLFLKNKEVVDNSSFAIFLVDTEKQRSVGTRTLNYLKEKNIQYINIK